MNARLMELLIVTGLFLAATDAQAWFGKQEAKEPPAKAAPAAPAESPRDKAAKEWLAKLNNTQWKLTVHKTGSSEVAYEDTVAFQGRRVTSDHLSTAGYADSNFTLTVQDGGTAVWETTQTKGGEGTMSWRGEVTGDTMSGMMREEAGGASTDFWFTASKASAAPPPQELPPAPPVSEAPAAPAPAQPASK